MRLPYSFVLFAVLLFFATKGQAVVQQILVILVDKLGLGRGYCVCLLLVFCDLR